MSPANRRWLLLSALLVTGAAPAVAQLPGESLARARSSLRAEFLARTYEEVEQTLEQWLDLTTATKLKGLDKFVADEALFSPIRMGTAIGPGETVDSLRSWLPRVSGYGFSVADFDASGSLVYLLGAVHYQVKGQAAAEREVVVAEAVMVLSRRGNRWQLRSYVEREVHR